MRKTETNSFVVINTSEQVLSLAMNFYIQSLFIFSSRFDKKITDSPFTSNMPIAFPRRYRFPLREYFQKTEPSLQSHPR